MTVLLCEFALAPCLLLPEGAIHKLVGRLAQPDWPPFTQEVVALAAVAASVVAASVVVAAASAAPRPVRATGPAPAAVPTFLPRSVLASGATRPSPVLRTSSTAVVASVVVAAAGAAV